MLSVLLVAWLAASASSPASMMLNGVVSDESCGASHLKDQNSDCVIKCLRGGASVGHPEWLPQRMVLVERRSGRVFIVGNPDALAGHEGQDVSVQTTRADKAHTVRVLKLLEQS